MRAALRRVWRLAFEALTSDIAIRLLIWILALASAGTATFVDSATTWALGALAAVLVFALASFLKREYEFRNENYAVAKRTNTLIVRDHGRSLTYEVTLRVMARVRNLRSCAIRLRWTGQTSLATAPMEPTSIGYQLERQTGEPFDVVFRFGRPLKRFRRRTVGVRIQLSEPQRTYKCHISLDPSAWFWTAFSSNAIELFWDRTTPVDPDSITAFSSRSGWDYKNDEVAFLQEWKSRDFKTVTRDDLRGREWKVTPVRIDRFYRLDYELSALPDPPSRFALPDRDDGR